MINDIDNKYIHLISSRLEKFKKVKDKYNFRCPLCGDSKHSKSKTRGWLLTTEKTDSNTIFKCFNCGEVISFKNFLKDIDEDLYRKYIAEKFLYKPERNISKHEDEDNKDNNLIKYDEFIKNTNVISCMHMNNSSLYLRKRKINKLSLFFHTNNYGKLLESLKLEKYKDEFEFKDQKLVIPHFNRDNNLSYLQFRSLEPNTKLRYKTYKVIEGEDKIWNLNNIDLNSKYIYVTEGALDASLLNNTIAMSGSDLGSSNTFINNNKNKIRIILDNEPRNAEISKKYKKLINEGFSVFIWPENIIEKDINDCLLAGIDINIFYNDKNYYNGMIGLLKLTEWVKVKI